MEALKIMEVLKILEDFGVINIAVIIGMIGIMTKLRKVFLDKLIEKVKKGWLKWLIMTLIALVLSFGLSALNFIAKFSLQEYIKQACLNWVFAWVFHDTIKNMFFKNKE